MSFTGEPENNINMEDEKMKVSFEEIGYMSATFAAERGEAGQVCKMAGNGRVAPCADGDAFIGVMESIRKGYAGVQILPQATSNLLPTEAAVSKLAAPKTIW